MFKYTMEKTSTLILRLILANPCHQLEMLHRVPPESGTSGQDWLTALSSGSIAGNAASAVFLPGMA